ncbi:MAG TPA: ABC transporter permease [Syntrophomonas sp.]|nr:ABC transporter permease [Syntrophomonas sp.]
MSFLAFQGSLELGIIYAIMALGVFLSFRTLNMPDLTVDGSFVLGAACSATFCSLGHPVLGILMAVLAGWLAGSTTALLHTKLKIQPLLAGILLMLGLYSVNLRVLGGKANISLVNQATVFKLLPGAEPYAGLLIPVLILLVMVGLLFWFLQTRLGLVLRATGDNDQMVRAVGVNTNVTILIGMALSNSLVALSGSLVAQYQSFADISMGVGMVVIGLASVIIGEVLFGINSLLRRLIAVVLGAILYRMIIAVALEFGMPATDLKLISAIIVALALSAPVIKERWTAKRKKYRVKGGGGSNHA